MKLYEFAISHYCEKVRWALDYKGIVYESRVLAPGPSAPKIYWLSGAMTVPVIDDRGRCMNESADIIDYLERSYLGSSLYSAGAGERTRVAHHGPERNSTSYRPLNRASRLSMNACTASV